MQLRQPTIKTEHDWHNEEVFIAEIFGIHKLHVVVELHISQYSNIEVHGAHFIAVGKKKSVEFTHYAQKVEFSHNKQLAIITEQASHFTVPELKKVLFSQSVQTVAEAQVMHEGIRIGQV